MTPIFQNTELLKVMKMGKNVEKKPIMEGEMKGCRRQQKRSLE